MSRIEVAGGGSGGLLRSLCGAYRPWAQWVGAGGGGWLQRRVDVWDWATGDDFVLRMSDALTRADSVVSLWSPAYFEREHFITPEWTAVLAEQTRKVGEAGSAERPSRRVRARRRIRPHLLAGLGGSCYVVSLPCVLPPHPARTPRRRRARRRRVSRRSQASMADYLSGCGTGANAAPDGSEDLGRRAGPEDGVSRARGWSRCMA